MKRIVCLILVCLFCILPMASCAKKADPLAESAITSILPDPDREKLHMTLTVSSRALEAHAGEKLFVYELLPGETYSDLPDKEPLLVKKVRAHMELSLPLYDGERSRLHSSFMVIFKDGSTLVADPRFVDAPERFSTSDAEFPWSGSQKGLYNTDAESALAYGSMHVLYEVRISELTDGVDSFSFSGTSYPISNAALLAIDRDIDKAFRAGMQVSLSLLPDRVPAPAAAVALMELLAERCNGRVTELLIGADEACSASDAARLCRYASLAFRSRTASTRISVATPAGSVDAAKAFLSDVMHAITVGGDMEWNALLQPVLGTDDEVMTPNNLDEVCKFALNEGGNGSAERVLVKLPELPVRNDPELQAARLAYAYRLALAGGASHVYYPTLCDDETGLCTADGEERLAGEVFRTIDTGLSHETANIILDNVGRNWEFIKAPAMVSRELLTGSVSVGAPAFRPSPAFAFSESEDALGFVGVACAQEPTRKEDASLGADVLSARFDTALSAPFGVRKVMENAEVLANVTSLALPLLVRTAENGNAPVTVTLVLEGCTDKGTRLSYSASAELTAGEWQTATFRISSFVNALDRSKPCTLSVLCSSPEGGDTPNELCLGDIDAHRLTKDGTNSDLFLALILGGVLLTFAVCFSLYLIGSKRKKNQ